MNPNVVGFLVEPIQGESGIIIPPDGYLKGLRRRSAASTRALLMADEIQSGLGRTGKLFACEHEGVRPDVVIIGKALAGGFYPVSAILADDEVMGVFHPGDHGSTFGGNPLGCAVAREALRGAGGREADRELGRAGRLLHRQAADASTARTIKEIRGRGLWIGVELKPEAGGARRYCEALEKQGPALQGDPRRHDPLRAAAVHHAGGAGLGLRADRSGLRTSWAEVGGHESGLATNRRDRGGDAAPGAPRRAARSAGSASRRR